GIRGAEVLQVTLDEPPAAQAGRLALRRQRNLHVDAVAFPGTRRNQSRYEHQRGVRRGENLLDVRDPFEQFPLQDVAITAWRRAAPGAVEADDEADAAHRNRLSIGNVGDLADGLDLGFLISVGLIRGLEPHLLVGAADQAEQRRSKHPDAVLHRFFPPRTGPVPSRGRRAQSIETRIARRADHTEERLACEALLSSGKLEDSCLSLLVELLSVSRLRPTGGEA